VVEGESCGPEAPTQANGFGSRVRHIRNLRGMTQKELAATVDRGHSMLAAIEGGYRQVHVDELVTFAWALNVSPMALLGHDEADHYGEGYKAGWNEALVQVHKSLRGLSERIEVPDV
jgi:transcriptional regulator with XRE-family HTH domain